MDNEPIDIYLGEEDIEKLRDGESIEVLVEKRSETSCNVLEITLYTKGAIGQPVEETYPHLFKND